MNLTLLINNSEEEVRSTTGSVLLRVVVLLSVECGVWCMGESSGKKGGILGIWSEKGGFQGITRTKNLTSAEATSSVINIEIRKIKKRHTGRQKQETKRVRDRTQIHRYSDTPRQRNSIDKDRNRETATREVQKFLGTMVLFYTLLSFFHHAPPAQYGGTGTRSAQKIRHECFFSIIPGLTLLSSLNYFQFF